MPWAFADCGTRTGGHRMSDGLISRKAVIEILENMIFEVGNCLAKSSILQTACKRIIGLITDFDNDKVI